MALKQNEILEGNDLMLYVGANDDRSKGFLPSGASAVTYSGFETERLPLGYSRTLSIDFSTELVDTTNKDNFGWQSSIATQQSITISAEVIASEWVPLPTKLSGVTLVTSTVMSGESPNDGRLLSVEGSAISDDDLPFGVNDVLLLGYDGDGIPVAVQVVDLGTVASSARELRVSRRVNNAEQIRSIRSTTDVYLATGTIYDEFAFASEPGQTGALGRQTVAEYRSRRYSAHLQDYYANKKLIYIEFGVGDRRYRGPAFISSMNFSADVNQVATATVELMSSSSYEYVIESDHEVKLGVHSSTSTGACGIDSDNYRVYYTQYYSSDFQLAGNNLYVDRSLTTLAPSNYYSNRTLWGRWVNNGDGTGTWANRGSC